MSEALTSLLIRPHYLICDVIRLQIDRFTQTGYTLLIIYRNVLAVRHIHNLLRVPRILHISKISLKLLQFVIFDDQIWSILQPVCMLELIDLKGIHRLDPSLLCVPR